MAKMRERREARQAGLLNTIAGSPTTSPATDLTDPDAPPLRMPDPGDRVRQEMMRGLVMRRLRGGRMGTILTDLLRRRIGQSRTATVTE